MLFAIEFLRLPAFTSQLNRVGFARRGFDNYRTSFGGEHSDDLLFPWDSRFLQLAIKHGGGKWFDKKKTIA